ncbi:unnamed protein product [Arctogadus glacialis]
MELTLLFFIPSLPLLFIVASGQKWSKVKEEMADLETAEDGSSAVSPSVCPCEAGTCVTTLSWSASQALGSEVQSPEPCCRGLQVLLHSFGGALITLLSLVPPGAAAAGSGWCLFTLLFLLPACRRGLRLVSVHPLVPPPCLPPRAPAGVCSPSCSSSLPAAAGSGWVLFTLLFLLPACRRGLRLGSVHPLVPPPCLPLLAPAGFCSPSCSSSLPAAAGSGWVLFTLLFLLPACRRGLRLVAVHPLVPPPCLPPLAPAGFCSPSCSSSLPAAGRGRLPRL